MFDKGFFVKLIFLFAVTISVVVIYLTISPYQNCKRDMYNSFEKAYSNTSTWSEKNSIINKCIDSTDW